MGKFNFLRRPFGPWHLSFRCLLRLSLLSLLSHLLLVVYRDVVVSYATTSSDSSSLSSTRDSGGESHWSSWWNEKHPLPIAVDLLVSLDPRGSLVQLLSGSSGSQVQCQLLFVLQAPRHNVIPKQSLYPADLTLPARRHGLYSVFPFSGIGLPSICSSVIPFPSLDLLPTAKRPVGEPPYRLVVW